MLTATYLGILLLFISNLIVMSLLGFSVAVTLASRMIRMHQVSLLPPVNRLPPENTLRIVSTLWNWLRLTVCKHTTRSSR